MPLKCMGIQLPWVGLALSDFYCILLYQIGVQGGCVQIYNIYQYKSHLYLRHKERNFRHNLLSLNFPWIANHEQSRRF